MSVYLVDRNLPGITIEQLAAAQQSAIETSRRFTEDGKSVRFIRSVYVPGESHVMCLFESAAKRWFAMSTKRPASRSRGSWRRTI